MREDVREERVEREVLPRVGGELPKPAYSFCSGGFFPGLKVSEESEKQFLDVLTREGIALEVLRPLSVLALTANPFRVPQPYQPKVLFNALVDAVGSRVPLFDVVNGLASLPEGQGASDEPDPA